MKFKLAVTFSLHKHRLSARPVMHWSWRSWSIIVHIDLLKSRTAGVYTVPDYWARANTKLTSMRLCDILTDWGPVCRTCFGLIWINEKWTTCSSLWMIVVNYTVWPYVWFKQLNQSLLTPKTKIAKLSLVSKFLVAFSPNYRHFCFFPTF